MRFQITMNMPSKNGSPVHQIIGESNVNSLAEFIDLMDKSLFVVVREIYRDQETGDYYPVGDVAINPSVIGKIKVFN
ncbi:MAG: hypothetical protein QM523_00140 [Candidatus Pacebacteria bacterium]|nr:hypothetical protein [Candidatus Paceibacterota bacterium]